MLCVKFANKCTQNENSKHMFKKTNNKINTRYKEKFTVTFANTERFRMLAIPYMQRLLNDEHKEAFNIY